MEILSFFYRYNKRFCILFIAFSIIQGVTSGAIIAFLNTFFQNLLVQDSTKPFSYGQQEVFLYGGLILINLIFSRQLSVATTKYTKTMVHNIRMRIVNKLKDVEYRSFEQIGEEDIFTILIRDTHRISSGSNTFLNLFSSIVIVIVCLAYLFFIFPLGLLITVVMISLGFGIYLVKQKGINKELKEARELESVFFSQMKDFVSGFKELKLSNKKINDIFSNYIYKTSDTSKNLIIRSMTKYIDNNLLASIFLYSLIGIIIFLFPFLIVDLTEVYSFLLVVIYILGPIKSIADSIPNIAMINIAINQVKKMEIDVMSLSNEEIITTNEYEKDTMVNNIVFKDVMFSYENEKEKNFELGPINLDIKRGKTYLICGENGAGKTTFLKLLVGLYKPKKGEISLNGRLLQLKDYQNYRELFSVIYSDYYLFKNLYGHDDSVSDDINYLLSKMGIEDKVSIDNNKLSTLNLSSGQKKRLALILSLVENKNIIVLDEWAAEQDPGFKRFFYEEIVPKMKSDGKTVILISHDEKYFNSLDTIIEIDNDGIYSRESI